MPTSKTKVTASLRRLCRKFDNKKAKGTTFRFLKKNYNVEAYIKLVLNEVNGMTLGSSPYPKHKRVAGLWTFIKDAFRQPTFFDFGNLLASMADFISSSQIEELKWLEIKKRAAESKLK